MRAHLAFSGRAPRPLAGSETEAEVAKHFVVIGRRLAVTGTRGEIVHPSARLAGKPFDYAARDKADASKPKTRASVVSEMEAAIAVSYPLVEKNAQPFLVGWLDHQGEHYGKLVSNYRMNNIVPPISRPK